jgi:hypothetical protein
VDWDIGNEWGLRNSLMFPSPRKCTTEGRKIPTDGVATFPDYKAGEWVTSFDGRILRHFDPDGDTGLAFKSTKSPKLVEAAVKAACGIGEWKPYYGKMRSP